MGNTPEQAAIQWWTVFKDFRSHMMLLLLGFLLTINVNFLTATIWALLINIILCRKFLFSLPAGCATNGKSCEPSTVCQSEQRQLNMHRQCGLADLYDRMVKVNNSINLRNINLDQFCSNRVSTLTMIVLVAIAKLWKMSLVQGTNRVLFLSLSILLVTMYKLVMLPLKVLLPSMWCPRT